MKKLSAKERQAQIDTIQALKDEDIDFSDIPETTNFDDFEVGRYQRSAKQPVSFRMDADVLAWFKKHDKYTSLINTVCREFMTKELNKAQKNKPKVKKIAAKKTNTIRKTKKHR